MRIVFLLAAMMIVGCSSGNLTRQSFNFDKEIPVDVSLETQNICPGAYTLAINYDPSVLRIVRIERGIKEHFDGVPFFDETTFSSGQTTITSFSLKTNLQPKKPSVYHVATVVFKRVNYGFSRISARLKTLSNSNGQAIEGRVSISPEVIE